VAKVIVTHLTKECCPVTESGNPDRNIGRRTTSSAAKRWRISQAHTTPECNEVDQEFSAAHDIKHVT